MIRSLSCSFLSVLILACSANSQDADKVHKRLVASLPKSWHTVSVQPTKFGKFDCLAIEASFDDKERTFRYECTLYLEDQAFGVHIRHQGVPHPNNPDLELIAMQFTFKKDGETRVGSLKDQYRTMQQQFLSKGRELYSHVKNSL